MKMSPKLLLCSAVLALAVVGCDSEDEIPPEDRVAEAENAEATLEDPSADGEDDCHRRERKHQRGKHDKAAKFAEMDANSDGSVSKEEAGEGRLAKNFDAIDADQSGGVTLEELRAHKHAKRGDGEGRGGKHKRHRDHDPEARATKMLEKYDTDGSGTLTAAEVSESRMAHKFAEIDADSDGAVTREELKAFKKPHHGRRGEHKRGEHKREVEHG